MAWQPGQSGNPSGRPKSNPYAELMLEEYAKEAVAVLVAGIRSEDEKTRILAAKDILDRRHGKAAQGITLSGDETAPLITRIERVIVHASDKDGSGI
jgi:hypothetical protein